MAWYDEAVFYHIYPLGLLGAPKQNTYEIGEHRLQELDPWIEHIKNIGCNAIYIGPLFESVGHGYETTDYKKLDSRLGDNEDLKAFVSNCHSNGIKVIFDGVFNHTGRDFFAFQDLKTNRESSAYKDWYCQVNFHGNNEYNDGFSYENWGGYNLLVKLNQKNPAVKNYIEEVIRFWVSEFDVDGIRLDAADVLDFDFMKNLRRIADDVKPDFWLMGEVIHGDYSKWVNDGTLHSVTNYVLHKALYSGHNDHNYFEIAHTVRRLNDLFGNTNQLKLYNFTDNHDVERIITKLVNKSNFVPVHILEYTLPGIPSIYYGSEFGIEGKKEKFSDDSLRPSLNIDDYKEAIHSNPYTKVIASLGRIRQQASVLSYGNYEEKLLTNRQYAFTRNTNHDTAVIIVNNDENACDISINGIRDGVYQSCLSGNDVTVQGGQLHAHLQANSGEIYLLTNEEHKITRVEEKSCPEKDIQLVSEENGKHSTDQKRNEQNIDYEEKQPQNKHQVSDAPLTDPQPAVTPSESVSLEFPTEPAEKEKKDTTTDSDEKTENSASQKYNLGSEYHCIDPDQIALRNDYEQMSVLELQVAVLEKMLRNGPVTEDMKRTVLENIYPDSLRNWVKSFHS